MRGLVLAAMVAVLTGCATRDTPGVGYGADYTPVIDMQGVDGGRYAADLDACRSMARKIDANQATTEGAIAGMFIGALVSGALGGGRQTTIDSANIGAMSSMGRAGGDALAGQKRIVINCMVGRGYRALEVTPALGSYQQPSPQAAASTPPMQPSTWASSSTRPAAPIGQFSYEVERLPEVKGCAAMPQASLINKGPGFELYTVACRNSDMLTVRCEMGNCRVMR